MKQLFAVKYYTIADQPSGCTSRVFPNMRQYADIQGVVYVRQQEGGGPNDIIIEVSATDKSIVALGQHYMAAEVATWTD